MLHDNLDSGLETHRSAAGGGRSRVLLAALVLVVVAVAASLIFGNRGESDTPLAAEQISEIAAPETAESSTTDESGPIRSDSVEFDAGAWFRSEVDGGATRYSILYPSPGGLRMLNHEGLAAIDTQNAIGFQDAVGFLLFTDGQQTWGVNPEDPSDTYIVSRNYEIVDMGIEGAVAFANYDADPVSVGISSFGGWGGGVELPPGTETLAVQGLGLLVLPETGGTFILTGKGLDPFSDDRIVAGTGSTVIAQRCNDEMVCGLFLSDAALAEGPEADAIELPVKLGAAMTASPDGSWVVVSEFGQGSEIVDVDTGNVWPLAGGPIDAVSWAPDSTFVSWLSGGSLHVAFPALQRQSTLTLPAAPSARSMIVTANPVTAP